MARHAAFDRAKRGELGSKTRASVMRDRAAGRTGTKAGRLRAAPKTNRSPLRYGNIATVYAELLEFGSTKYARHRDWRDPNAMRILRARRVASLRKTVARYKALTPAERAWLHKTYLDSNRFLFTEVNAKCRQHGIKFVLKDRGGTGR